MQFDIVSTLKKYQGMCRTLEPLEGLSKRNKKHCQEMFDLYLSYIDLELECAGKVEDKNTANRWIALCDNFKEYDVPCEVIVYDDKPLDSAFGYDVIEKIIPFQDHGDVEWEPCYIYRLIY